MYVVLRRVDVKLRAFRNAEPILAVVQKCLRPIIDIGKKPVLNAARTAYLNECMNCN